MNILFLSNNQPVSQPLLEEIRRRKNLSVIASSAKVEEQFLVDHKIDWIVSYCYMYLIPKNILKAVGYKAVNLHVSFLPWNRGAYPNFWSFIDATPKGASVHMIDEGLDTGQIVSQKECFFDEQKETLFSSYQHLNKIIMDIFSDSFPLLITGKLKPRPQVGVGSTHKTQEMLEFKEHMGSALYKIPVCDVIKQYREFIVFHKGAKYE